VRLGRTALDVRSGGVAGPSSSGADPDATSARPREEKDTSMARKNEVSRNALPIALSDEVLGVVCGGRGRASFGDLSVIKVTDKASPKLYEACAKGSHLPEVVIELW
jgi:Type VI secretion system effector, Hcp